MRITMFDRLRQGERFCNDHPRTPPFARQHRLAIGTQQEAPVALPAITEPAERALVGACDRPGLAPGSPGVLLRRAAQLPPFFLHERGITHRFPPGSGADRWPAPA